MNNKIGLDLIKVAFQQGQEEFEDEGMVRESLEYGRKG